MVAPHHRRNMTEYSVWRGKQPMRRLVKSACFLVSLFVWGIAPAFVRVAGADGPVAQRAAPRHTVPAKDTPKAAPVAAPLAPAGAALLARVRNTAKQGLLDLENAIAQAELVIAVRMLDVSETKIVHGGKQEQVTAQYRFEPVRILKGIYARDVLLLTGQDLGIYRYGASPGQIDRGQVFLLLLGRSGPGYFNCNQAGTLDLSIPRLGGPEDPLLSAVETLIAVTQERDRAKKVALLVDPLRLSKGREAVPLLVSLQRRALLAAQTPRVLDALIRPLRDRSAVLNEAVGRTLGAVLEADYLEQQALRDAAADALIGALKDAGPDLAARVALLDALGATGKSERRWQKARSWLRIDRAAPTIAERAAQLRAIAKLAQPDQKSEVGGALEALPLDAPQPIEMAAGHALGAIDPAEAARRLLARLVAKYDAGLDVAVEIGLIGELPRAVATPALLEAARRSLDFPERIALAAACDRVADPKLVPILAVLIDPNNLQVRWTALDALQKINTPEAARAAWPHLAEEGDLTRKLRLAEFIGRHGYRGGYPYAIEHLADPALRDVAVDALEAIREPKAIPELRAIWQRSNDLAWSAAAILALGRLGQSDIASRLLELAQELKDPLTAPALIALGDLKEPRALPLVRAGLVSRSDEVVIAAARAARKLLAVSGARADDVRDELAALLSDVHASMPVRQAALETLVGLDDPRLARALKSAVRDAGLEGSPLLQSIEERLAARKEQINL
jgi:HEAT repeat protein